jgi:TrmH family RNA methyltransferase
MLAHHFTHHFPIVLVEPGDNLNIGSVARAMMNLNFHDLRLVAPRGYERDRAKITACWGEPLLDKLVTYSSLPEALSDVEDAVGFSAREGNNRSALLLPEWSDQVKIDPSRKTALVFGPEESGLRVEHLEQCRLHIQIPTTPECYSMNLSHAALVAMYELTRILSQALPKPKHEDPTWNEYQQLDRLVEESLTLCRFYREGTPAPIPRVVKNLFRRIQPNSREMKILLGMFDRLSKTIRRSE